MRSEPQPVSSADVRLAKSEVAQGAEGFCVHVDRLGLHALAVRSPIGVTEANAHRAALDEQLAAMGRAMVHSAQSEQIFELVRPTFGAQLDVMDIEKARVSAAGHAAATLVAQQHGAA